MDRGSGGETMNIFVLSECPIEAAQMQCDKHVVKMIVETAQMLCTVGAGPSTRMKAVDWR